MVLLTFLVLRQTLKITIHLRVIASYEGEGEKINLVSKTRHLFSTFDNYVCDSCVLGSVEIVSS